MDPVYGLEVTLDLVISCVVGLIVYGSVYAIELCSKEDEWR